MIEKLANEIEKDLEFVTIVGVKEKIRMDVVETISSLQRSGCKIWMLSGDTSWKASYVAIRTGMVPRTNTRYYADFKKLFSMKSVRQ